MKKIKLLFCFLLLLWNIQMIAQEKSVRKRTTIEVEVARNGKTEKAIGYLVLFEMENLNAPYSAVVLEKNFIENIKQTILYFPMKTGERCKYRIDDISKYLFTTKSNSLAIIRLGEIANKIEDQNIYSNVVFVPESVIADFSFPIDKNALKELKQSWQKSMEVK